MKKQYKYIAMICMGFIYFVIGSAMKLFEELQ